MFHVIRRRPTTAHLVTAVLVSSLVLVGLSTPANAAESPGQMLEWSTQYTATETVTVTETATVNGYEGTGSATATKTATATGTAKAATEWEVYYYAVIDAATKASSAAKTAADAEARPIAKQRAEADARAKATAGPQYIEWTTTSTQQATVTVNETATYQGYEGAGTATATSSATGTGSARELTNWEVFYYATVRAQANATSAAKAAAEAEARPIAKQRAEADARAKAAAGPQFIEWSTTSTQEQTITVTETATVNGYEGYGTATSTKTATATGTARAATNWEVFYYATVDAVTKARDAARSAADAEARALAKQRAQADAQAQADAAATPTPTPTPTGTPTSPTPTPTTPVQSGPSCGAAVLKANGSPWTCTFADSFSGTSLDSSKWDQVETATSGFTYGDCFVDDNVTVVGGSLQLTTKKVATPVTCNHSGQSLTSNYNSGSVSTLGKFSQTYGRVEIRASMPTTSGPGLQSALWLVPDDPGFFGGWPGSGEIDVAEFFSNYADRVIPTLHYNSLIPFNQRTNNDCLVYKPTDFHTYGLEWTSQRLKITVDGVTCLEHTISPLAPLVGSAPFNRPFNINLTQLLGSGDNALPAGADPKNATLKVDYVRVWS